jgi:hypothetical protein
LSVAASAKARDAASWIHAVTGLVINEERGFRAFKIKAAAAEGEHLVGSAIYREKLGRPPLKIDGTQTADGRFWPRVIAEVANDVHGPWKTLEQPSSQGKPAEVTLRFYEANVMLYVNLDVFRPLIGKMRYGRLVLANGEAALFELKDLLPSANDAARAEGTGDWDREILFGYLEDPLARGPFAIAEISSKSGHLRGAGVYLDPEEPSATKMEGTETQDGDFWPYATLQIVNDPAGEWKTIGESRNPGKPVTVSLPPKKAERIIYVDLDAFHPFIGKFGYGKVVLRNGRSAAFDLLDLLPPRNGE